MPPDRVRGPHSPTPASVISSAPCPRPYSPPSRRPRDGRSMWRCCGPSRTIANPFPRQPVVGLLGVLTALASDRPTLIAIDDVQWLDVEFECAAVFAAWRLTDQRLGYLLTCRVDPWPSTRADSTLDATVERMLPANRHHRIQLPPLTSVELAESRLGVGAREHKHRGEQSPDCTTPHAVTRSSHSRSRRRCSIAANSSTVTRMVPIPPNIQELVGGRLALLPADAMRVVQISATTTRPTISVIRSALANEDIDDHLRVACDAGIVELHGDRVTFTHPLLASVAYLQTPASADPCTNVWRVFSTTRKSEAAISRSPSTVRVRMSRARSTSPRITPADAALRARRPAFSSTAPLDANQGTRPRTTAGNRGRRASLRSRCGRSVEGAARRTAVDARRGANERTCWRDWGGCSHR